MWDSFIFFPKRWTQDMHFTLIFCAFRAWLCHLHPPATSSLFYSPWAQKIAQTTQKSFESLNISSTRFSACMLDLLWLALLLSPAINFNQILCTQLYSCLNPSKVLLLLRKPLPQYPRTWLCCLLPSISPPFPSPHFPSASRGNSGTALGSLSHLPPLPLEWKLPWNS